MSRGSPCEGPGSAYRHDDGSVSLQHLGSGKFLRVQHGSHLLVADGTASTAERFALTTLRTVKEFDGVGEFVTPDQLDAFAPALVGFFAYNQLRFGTPFESGYALATLPPAERARAMMASARPRAARGSATSFPRTAPR